MYHSKFSILMFFCISLIACSNDIKVIEEPDYYTKTEDIKRNYEDNKNKGKEDMNNEQEKVDYQNANQDNLSTPPTTSSSGDERKETILKGQDVHFTDDMYLAISQQAFDEFMNNVIQNNTDATHRMVNRGDLILINKGTEAYVINRTISGLAEIEIIETGIRGFVVVEVLEKKK